jgi:transcriptional regulator with XRE-family HTH domain
MSERNEPRTIGRAIDARLRALGLSDSQASRRIGGEGVAQSTFSRWHAGTVVPTEKWYPALADWLGMSVAEVALLAQVSRNDPRDELQRALEPIGEAVRQIAELSARVQRLEARLDQAER